MDGHHLQSLVRRRIGLGEQVSQARFQPVELRYVAALFKFAEQVEIRGGILPFRLAFQAGGSTESNPGGF